MVTFSPTHTSKLIGEAIVDGLRFNNIDLLDLTLNDNYSPKVISSDTLVVVSFPVYGGAIAPLAIERIKKLSFNNALAIPVVVYGNRAYENALAQLGDYLIANGCRVIAGGAFIGEHSYSTKEYPIAAGRPNKYDIETASSFGKEVKMKLDKYESVNNIPEIDLHSLKALEDSNEIVSAFWNDIKNAKMEGREYPRTPLVDEQLCIHCGICAQNCPVNAITVTDDDIHTDVGKCIKCCACIKYCPQNARNMTTLFSPYLSKYFDKDKSAATIL